MTETDDTPPPPDTLPPARDPEPTTRELMTALLATRDLLVDEFARAFVSLNGRMDRLEEDTAAQNAYVRDQLDTVKRLVENVATAHLALEKRVETLETRVESIADASDVVEALRAIAQAIRPST
jgi:phage shock protein A